MHTEQLSNLSVWSIVIGWIIAAAVTSLLVLVFTGAGWMSVEGTPHALALLAVALGFFVGGYLTGTRDIEAPILHGIGIGLTTLVVWFAVNLLAALFVDGGVYGGLSATVTAGLLLLQMLAAVMGAWIADRRALRGKSLPGERLG